MPNNPDFEIYRANGSEGSNTFSGGYNYVSRVSVNGMQRVIDRLSLEDKNIPIKNVPVGSREGVSELLGMFDKARQGFRLLFRMPSHQADNINLFKFFNEVGNSLENEEEKSVEQPLPDNKILNPNETFNLSVSLAFQTSLFKLVQAENVNFYYLGIIPSDCDAHLILHSSYWKQNISSESIWRNINEIEGFVKKAIFQRGTMKYCQGLFKAAHFLGANTSLKKVS